VGTSSNIPSPRIPRWRAATAAVGHTAVSPERQSSEIWGAVSNEWGGGLVASLSVVAPAVTRIAAGERSPAAALSQFETWSAENRAIGLAADLAPSALARVVASRGTPTQAVGELFAEIVDYYVSRDLPSVVGAPHRIKTAADAVGLKQRLKDLARQAVAAEGTPPQSPDRLVTYMRRILSRLSTEER